MGIYVKKPVIVQAIQVKWGMSLNEVVDFVGINNIRLDDNVHDMDTLLYIKTLEGDMKVSLNDYIIKGIKGEFYPCKPDIFEATYEQLPE